MSDAINQTHDRLNREHALNRRVHKYAVIAVLVGLVAIFAGLTYDDMLSSYVCLVVVGIAQVVCQECVKKEQELGRQYYALRRLR